MRQNSQSPTRTHFYWEDPKSLTGNTIQSKIPLITPIRNCPQSSTKNTRIGNTHKLQLENKFQLEKPHTCEERHTYNYILDKRYGTPIDHDIVNFQEMKSQLQKLLLEHWNTDQ